MAWELREREDGTWAWEVFQSAYGLVCGIEDSLALAAAKMATAEGELLEEPMPEPMRRWFLQHADEHLRAIRHGLVDEVGRHVFPLDRPAFRAKLTAL